jgi:hypothetical protein
MCRSRAPQHEIIDIIEKPAQKSASSFQNSAKTLADVRLQIRNTDAKKNRQEMGKLCLKAISNLACQKTQNDNGRKAMAFDFFGHHSQEGPIGKLPTFVEPTKTKRKRVRIDRADLAIVRPKNGEKSGFEIVRGIFRIMLKRSIDQMKSSTKKNIEVLNSMVLDEGAELSHRPLHRGSVITGCPVEWPVTGLKK